MYENFLANGANPKKPTNSNLDNVGECGNIGYTRNKDGNEYDNTLHSRPSLCNLGNTYKCSKGECIFSNNPNDKTKTKEDCKNDCGQRFSQCTTDNDCKSNLKCVHRRPESGGSAWRCE